MGVLVGGCSIVFMGGSRPREYEREEIPICKSSYGWPVVDGSVAAAGAFTIYGLITEREEQTAGIGDGVFYLGIASFAVVTAFETTAAVAGSRWAHRCRGAIERYRSEHALTTCDEWNARVRTELHRGKREKLVEWMPTRCHRAERRSHPTDPACKAWYARLRATTAPAKRHAIIRAMPVKCI